MRPALIFIFLSSVFVACKKEVPDGISYVPDEVNVGEQVQFTTYQRDLGTSYVWNFGDGGNDNTFSETETYTYQAAGSYVVSVNITDPNGNQEGYNTTIEVKP